MSDTAGDVLRKFVPADFAYVAKYLRTIRPSNDTGGCQIFLARIDLTIILAALDAASEDCG